MRNIMKKMVSIVMMVTLVLTLSACDGMDFSAYLKALLDSHYLNDSTGYVELGLGTKEEAEIGHRNYLNSQIERVEHFDRASEETIAEYTALLDKMFSRVRYTVGEAVKVDDDTVEVEVTYETMILYSMGIEEMEGWILDRLYALVEEKGYYVNESDINEWSAKLVMDLMADGVEKATYSEPKTMMFRIGLVDETWTPNEDDFLELDYALLNADQLLGNLERGFEALLGFDAGSYMQAILDMFFKGDITGFVEQEIGTAEYGEAIYQANLDAQVDNLRIFGNVSEEVEEGYRKHYADLYANLRYEVLEAVQVDEDNYDVTISYQKMYFMDKMTPVYREGLALLTEQWNAVAKETGSAPSGDEIADQMFKLQLACMEEAMSQVTYDETETFVIRLEWSEDEQLWKPNEEQYIEFEYCLLDFENMRLSY